MEAILFTAVKALFWIAGLVFAAAVFPRFLFGMVVITEEQIGVIVKRFAFKKLPAGRLVALNGEAGYQADTLGPGWHFGYFPWQFSVEKQRMTDIPAGEIGLIIAKDGNSIPQNRILGQTLQCDNFQDARKFLTSGGEKGRQLGILTAGKYRINTGLFDVVTTKNAKQYGVNEARLKIYALDKGVGVVTTMDGQPIGQGEIAGQLIDGHENFQNAQEFIKNGGKRGLQEQLLLSGSWNLNPWFVDVERADMTEIPIGSVGVVISYVGKEHKDISGPEFKHGDLVEKGHKGVWAEPLYPGKHPINVRTMRVEPVPTTNLALNWATNRSEAHKLDEKLSSITVRSKDGFSFNLDVCQVIHIGAKEASKVISRFGSMKNLVDQVLEPAIGNYFRNSAQAYSVLDFIWQRNERQKEAAQFISAALKEYDVEAVDTLIGDINAPEVLMKTLMDKKMAEELKKTFELQEAAQKQRQSLVKEQSLADTQPEIVKAEREVSVSKLQAEAAINRAKGESEAVSLRAKGDGDALRLKGEGEAASILSVGQAKAKAYELGVKAMGSEEFTSVQIMNVIGEKNVKLIPETLITGDGSAGLMTGLLANLFQRRTAKNTNGSGKPVEKAIEAGKP